ncbi:MAG: SIS domain-containing protein [Lachnospiraceae bacterium]|nr:SIS domain-containing protein [Lachnospiraceae bacterium]
MSKVYEYLDELVERYPCLKICKDDINKAFEIIRDSYNVGGKLLVAGNGGSAADSEHIVGELMKGFVKPRQLDKDIQDKLSEVDTEMGKVLGEKLQGALPAIALVDHVALSTAYLNDMDPLLGFAQQLYGYGNKEDVFLAISTSGNSQNILYACTVAKAKGLKVVGLTGKDGGKLKDMCDVAIVVPEAETFKIQELHLPVYHCLCLMLEEKMFK